MGAPLASKPNVPDLAVDWTASTPTIYRIISDHLGSPRVVVNAQTGDVMLAVRYDVFGKPELLQAANGWDLDTLPFGFAGGMFDEATGLVRFGARDYDPMTGRWTSKDPIRFEGAQTNLYVYVGGDPVNVGDPSGLSPNCDACLVCTAAARIPWARCYKYASRIPEPRARAAAMAACSAMMAGCAFPCLLCNIERTRPVGPDPNPTDGCHGASSEELSGDGGGGMSGNP